MEKLEERKIETIEKIHQFYCDECGKYLGESEEYSDGYYEEIESFELKFYLPDGWYEKKNILCAECSKNFLDSIRKTFIEKGFCKE